MVNKKLIGMLVIFLGIISFVLLYGFGLEQAGVLLRGVYIIGFYSVITLLLPLGLIMWGVKLIGVLD